MKYFLSSIKKYKSLSSKNSFFSRLNFRCFFVLLFSWAQPAVADNTEQPLFSNYKITEIASGLSSPWSMVQLNKNTYLVSERTGSLRLISKGNVSEPIKNVPSVFARSQGGLMDLVLHPNFEQNQWIYITYAFGKREQNALRLIRAKLQANQLVDQQELLTIAPWKDTPVHYGARLTFLKDNSLLLTSGDGFDYRESAQKPDSLLGKIIRLADDGSIPADNPFVKDPAVRSEIWSFGHRNPQGIAYDAKRDKVYSNEHGPKGGDEINLIEKGKNYGWPVITQGVDYSGALITPFKEYRGMEQPLVDWTPSIAPSSLVVYYGLMFPELNGNLLSTTLKSKELRRVKLVNSAIQLQQSLFTEINARLRHVMVNKQGAIMLLTDDGRVLEVSR
jgi:glucose/arabinose dehydrogenase